MGIFNNILKKSVSSSEILPELRYHVSNTVVNFTDDFLVGVIRFKGESFESIDDNILEINFDVLNSTFASIAKDNADKVVFNTYLKRRKINVDTEYKFTNKFCQDFSDKYVQRFNNKDYFDNYYYLAITLKYTSALADAIADLESILSEINKKLNQYEPKILTAFKNEHGVLCSEVYDFFYETLNACSPLSSVPLTGTPLYEVLPDSTLHFGYDVLQIKNAKGNKFATCFDLKDFPMDTFQGRFDSALLSLNFEYNLVQSFKSFSIGKTKSKIETQLNFLKSTEDKAEHQRLELIEAQGFNTSGELNFGEYHSALIVFGDTPQQAVDNGTTAITALSSLGGAVFRKATLSMTPCYFSQFPRFPDLPRPMFKSSRNLASTFSLHNYSVGKAKNNPLGDGKAIMPLETLSKTLYNFNFHYTNLKENNIGEAVAGHTLILGATGVGKTTLQSAMVTMTQRYNPAIFAIDKDAGMKNIIKALDGDYFSFQEGEPTGINPFQFQFGGEEKPSKELTSFLVDLVIACASTDGTRCTSEEETQIKHAVDTVMALPIEKRRFASLQSIIPQTGGNGLSERLAKWCYTTKSNGRYSWCLDNATNMFNPNDFHTVGFDIGDLMREGYQPTEPLLACLLYLKNMMVGNHETVLTIIEECWLPLKYKTPQEMILDVLKTGRKRGEFIMLVTQSPAELIKSPIFPAIVEQTPTKIFLPNPDANYDDEDSGYKKTGLTFKEFKLIKEAGKNSRQFLVKQGHESSVALLDLYGFTNEINVLSATKTNVEILDNILDCLPKGVKSNQWLPVFYEALRLKKEGIKINYNELTNHLQSEIIQ